MLLDWLPARIEKRATFKDADGWLADWLRGGRPTVSGEAVGHRVVVNARNYVITLPGLR
jgi:hypothetical protein